MSRPVRRTLALATALALTGPLVAHAGPAPRAAAAPTASQGAAEAGPTEQIRASAASARAERERTIRAERTTPASRVPTVLADTAGTRRPVAAYPRQRRLPVPAPVQADASLRLGLTPYHDIAKRLNAVQRRSDRVSVEVIGRSTQGRDLYLVTLTAPETREQARAQEQMRRRIRHEPATAARDRRLHATYKAPVYVNANIHGNEWEGTDAVLRYIETMATAKDAATRETLRTTRIHLVVTMNPDGRVGNTRVNGAGFDMNRDFVTVTQPEVAAARRQLIDIQPLVMLDLHGYVNGTLIEPTTPPHGENYEWDLFIRHAWPNGLGMEKEVLALGLDEARDGVRAPQIPLRDTPEGWDGWPPIFTPQYAAYHGAVAHTIEIPLRVNNADYATLPVDELRRRSAINTDVAEAAVRGGVRYTTQHRRALLADQIEIFRRGVAGEAQRPAPLGSADGNVGPEDIYLTRFPRAYVIPAGTGQRSEVAAARLVDLLVANDVEVTRASRPVRVGPRTWPAGSYVVDMRQAKRGLANTILDKGSDISARVDAMYDVSGWSHGLLWGARVDRVESGRLQAAGRRVASAAPTGGLSGRGALALRLDDPADLAALNDLLAAGVAVRWTDDGEVVVPAGMRAQAARVAREHGVRLRATRATGPAMEPLQVAAAAPAQELHALAEMGFDVTTLSTKALNEGAQLDGLDSLYVGAGLAWGQLSPAAQAEVRDFLAAGGGVVARGAAGAAFVKDAQLLPVTAVVGRADANGVVRVENAGGPVAAGAPGSSFVYSPLWFTGLGEGVRVEQRYASEGPLVSGHWRADAQGAGGPEAARGQASVVSGTVPTGPGAGAGVVAFGTEPMFRAHPKGLYAQVGRALFWSAQQR